ncbi:MAG: hypothetical protein ACYSUI_05625 [Planctomycetota bacterium]
MSVLATRLLHGVCKGRFIGCEDAPDRFTQEVQLPLAVSHPDLAAIFQAWPTLPEPVGADIPATVKNGYRETTAPTDTTR